MRRAAVISAGLALAALGGGAAAAQPLADGFFACTIGDAFLGEIAIADGRFSGPAYDRKFGDWYPLAVTPPTIAWGGPVGGISEAGEIVATVMKKDRNGGAGFDITIRNKDSGNFQTISCSPAG